MLSNELSFEISSTEISEKSGAFGLPRCSSFKLGRPLDLGLGAVGALVCCFHCGAALDGAADAHLRETRNSHGMPPATEASSAPGVASPPWWLATA